MAGLRRLLALRLDPPRLRLARDRPGIGQGLKRGTNGGAPRGNAGEGEAPASGAMMIRRRNCGALTPQSDKGVRTSGHHRVTLYFISPLPHQPGAALSVERLEAHGQSHSAFYNGCYSWPGAPASKKSQGSSL